MEITAAIVKDLREKTGVGMMDCKKALVECNGDIEKAIIYLREKGISKAAAKAERATKEGRIHSYIHGNGKIGVLIEVNCETDFVARTDNFINLCKDLAMQIAANNPLALSEDKLDPAVIEKEREILKNTALNEGKKEAIIDKVVDGQIQKFIKQNCLLEQEFVKDPDKTVKALLTDAMLAMGENIQISRFVRFALGE